MSFFVLTVTLACVGNKEYGLMYPEHYDYLELKRIYIPEGYVDQYDNYHYYRRDHLGNVREVWKATDAGAQTVQRTRYYPSGLPWEYQAGDSASLQPYKYGGKEFVETHGLDMYDSHARWYDPRIIRTTSPDPLAEKYYDTSPYAWCGNNPVNAVDPDGRKVLFAPGVSKEFERHFAKSVRHLNEHKASNMLYQLEQSDKIYYIAESTEEGSYYDPRTNTILWNPLSALLTNELHELSPTTILNHEVDHALQHDINPEQIMLDFKKRVPDYGNVEERRVITGSEQETAQKLGEIKAGEVTRKDHLGTVYETIDPTSTEWANPFTITPKKEEDEHK